MWIAYVRIVPKAEAGSRLDELRDWNIVRAEDDDDFVSAYGEFKGTEAFTSGLNSLNDLCAYVEPLDISGTKVAYAMTADKAPGSFTAVAGTVLDEHGGSATGGGNGVPVPKTPSIANFPSSVWEAMDKQTRSRTAAKMVTRWVDYLTDRREQVAWADSRENRLLAHVADDGARSVIAGHLLSEEFRAAAHRADMAKASVEMAMAIKVQFEGWTKLAGKVPALLGWSIFVSCLFVAAGVWLVWQQRINGIELLVLLFMAILSAVSPAVLLLLGRPLKGLDSWTPDSVLGKGKDPAEQKKADDAPKSDTKAKKPDDVAAKVQRPAVDTEGTGADTAGQSASKGAASNGRKGKVTSAH